MSWWSAFADRIQCHAPLGRLTWYRLGGCARYLFRPRDPADLALLTQRAKEENIDVRVLGSGANVLVMDDGFDGVVVRLDQPAFRRIVWNGPTDVCVGAGVELMPFAGLCSRKGLSGLEYMAGIPATAGGAVRMNAGGRFGDFGDAVREVSLLNDDGTEEVWPHDRVGFGYRRSGIGPRTVLSARLALVEDDPVRTFERYKAVFRTKRQTQPLAEASAGCVFKNPRGHSAGALIDQAGLKGTRLGGARVSERHANFIVADHGAKSLDVLHLIDFVRERILRLFGLELETEIDIWRSAAGQVVFR